MWKIILTSFGAVVTAITGAVATTIIRKSYTFKQKPFLDILCKHSKVLNNTFQEIGDKVYPLDDWIIWEAIIAGIFVLAIIVDIQICSSNSSTTDIISQSVLQIQQSNTIIHILSYICAFINIAYFAVVLWYYLGMPDIEKYSQTVNILDEIVSHHKK